MIKRRKLRLYVFRVEGAEGTAAGYCHTYFLDVADSHSGAEFFLVRSSFSNRGVLGPEENPSTFQLELRIANQAHVELPDRKAEADWIAERLRDAFEDVRVTVDEIAFD